MQDDKSFIEVIKDIEVVIEHLKKLQNKYMNEYIKSRENVKPQVVNYSDKKTNNK